VESACEAVLKTDRGVHLVVLCLTPHSSRLKFYLIVSVKKRIFFIKQSEHEGW